jgi:hypothetical protein
MEVDTFQVPETGFFAPKGDMAEAVELPLFAPA